MNALTSVSRKSIPLISCALGFVLFPKSNKSVPVEVNESKLNLILSSPEYTSLTNYTKYTSPFPSQHRKNYVASGLLYGPDLFEIDPVIMVKKSSNLSSLDDKLDDKLVKTDSRLDKKLDKLVEDKLVKDKLVKDKLVDKSYDSSNDKSYDDESHDDESYDLVGFYHLGNKLTSQDGQIHNGIISTILDEGLCTTGFNKLPSKRGVTAKLNINFINQANKNTTVILKAKVVQHKGRKVVINGQLSELGGHVIANGNCILVEPKWFRYFSWI